MFMYQNLPLDRMPEDEGIGKLVKEIYDAREKGSKLMEQMEDIAQTLIDLHVPREDGAKGLRQEARELMALPSLGMEPQAASFPMLVALGAVAPLEPLEDFETPMGKIEELTLAQMIGVLYKESVEYRRMGERIIVVATYYSSHLPLLGLCEQVVAMPTRVVHFLANRCLRHYGVRGTDEDETA